MSKVVLSVDHNIATILLNYPEKNNVLCPETIALLSEAYSTALQDQTVRMILLKAEGKHFCAGADLSHMLAMANAPFIENVEDAKKLADLFYLIYTAEKPTLCYIHGAVRGGGIGLLAAHDIVIAEKNTTFAFTEVKLGLLPAVISPFVLQRIGYQAAKYKMLTADIFNTDEALRLQLIDKICAEAEIPSVINSFSQTLPEALTQTKRWLQYLQPITHMQLEEAAYRLAKARQTSEAKLMIENFLSRHTLIKHTGRE